MFFFRSSATLRKSKIQRLEPNTSVPSNTPLSYHENEEFEGTQSSSDDIFSNPLNSLYSQDNEEKSEDVKIIFSKMDTSFTSSVEKIISSRSIRNDSIEDTSYQEEKVTMSGDRNNSFNPVISRPENAQHPNKFNNKPTVRTSQIVPNNSCPKKIIPDQTKKPMNTAVKKFSINRYKNITSKVDTGLKKINNKRDVEKTEEPNRVERQCLAIQTSGIFQDGSGDVESKYQTTLSEQEKEKLERFRRINMKILEAVSNPQDNSPEEESSTETEDFDSDLESLEELQKEAAEEELEEQLNEEALKACLFLNQNYPNYFQHLVIRYQLNVPTTDQKELRMRKIDIIRIAADGEEKLERLEDMYKERAVRNPVNIFCDEYK